MEITELKVTAQLSEIHVCLQTASRPLANMDVDGLDVAVCMRKSCTQVDAVLHSVSVSDLNPETMYNKVGVKIFEKYVYYSNYFI